ncbi:DegV family protein [Anaerobium acetethylicum]|uniref:EDD domain protein, DegV family n=1 Tax=Anaerobium acetethylicum TaxID=1619234 RepID=A0A1D3TT90_9FIRM|nr:DegV family protein [Anaerobium acetethylicum]SCP97104.1 EDD domain protein, DegV family [Anaerobium acetethylicum]
MSFKIVIDSCGELPENYKNNPNFESVPLTIDVDDFHIIDDETFDQADFLKKVAASPNAPKSACPSPERYMQAYETDADNVYVVTLSSQLSGSYNSAELAKSLYLEEHPGKNIHVFDSRSASVGETLIGLKVEEYEEMGLSFEEIVEKVENYRKGARTYFVLETLETLRKNGRLSNLKAFVAGALNIKPVMGATPEGTIYQIDQARGMNKALAKMVSVIEKNTPDSEERILGISHCNCPERAEYVKGELQRNMKFRDVLIVDTAGISSTYASDGGIIVVL